MFARNGPYNSIHRTIAIRIKDSRLLYFCASLNVESVCSQLTPEKRENGLVLLEEYS